LRLVWKTMYRHRVAREYQACQGRATYLQVNLVEPGTWPATTMPLQDSPCLQLLQKMFLQYREAQTVPPAHFCAWAKWRHRVYRWQDRDAQSQKYRAHRGRHQW